MRRLMFWVGTMLLCLAFAGPAAFAQMDDEFNDDTEILEFESMVGVSGPFLGDLNPIREINGGGRPWVLEEAEGELKANGMLEVEVEGLIIPDTEPGFGFNPAAFFLAAVSCLTFGEDETVVVENVFTQMQDTRMIGDPRNGDAKIRALLDLPDPCFAPLVFVTSPTGSWFAVTGR
ncbi:hypothetical protein DESUT3_32280 [Desulfuromonas versatilis]|uniref:Uncharacterized protein n=1 Tax=Desulfuromonas versatilis TaxID=2802975 RepID=A0ABM8HV32_9BACT|nr:hypothetical protein [Desulfuromonas versatilis]BCR06159.1 hypothetical protein DESUT3_32280 [Desulfuromonas versatilis]